MNESERFAHRLENFSDIVLAFALGQMSLSLTFPKHIEMLYRNPTWLLAFLVTFAIVAALWYRHHRIFEEYFEPVPLQVALNFVLLALVLLLAYMLQVYLHFAATAHAALAATGYLLAFGATWLVLGIFQGVGVRRRWVTLDLDRRRRAARETLRNIGIGLALLIGLAVTGATRTSPYESVWSIPIVAIVIRIVVARRFPKGNDASGGAT